MTVTMEICAEGRVLFFIYADPLTVSEIADFYEANRKHRDAVKHTVHCLIDVRGMSKVPFGALRTRNGPGFTHPRSGQIVFIGASHLARSLALVAATFTGNTSKLHFFDTEPEAWTFLDKIIDDDRQAEV
jgi:hypothetical protein